MTVQTVATWHVTGGAVAVRPAADRVVAVLRGHGLDPGREDGLRLAVHEVLANALEHGHRGRADVPIHVEVALAAAGRFAVRVADHALGGRWDPGANPDDDVAAPRGRGLNLVADAADQVTVRRGSGRSEVALIVDERAVSS